MEPARAAAAPRPAGHEPVVLVTWPDYDLDHPELGGALTHAGYVLRYAPRLSARSPAELQALLDGDVVAAIVSTDPFTAEVLASASASTLRVIARVGVGVDSIDVAVATARGIAVTVTPGANEDTVADHTVALMLAALRRVAEKDAAVRAGRWERTGPHAPRLLTGATVGLVGYGNIGRRVARRLAGFDVELIVSDPALDPTGGGGSDPAVVPLDELLERGDVVSLHCPLGPATRGLIGRAELARMRPHAVLVNVARGPVVDEAALIEALRAGTIGGAALDVFETEPPTGSPLLDRADVVLSPHVGGISTASLAEMTHRATATVIDVLAGRRPPDLANPSVVLRATPTEGVSP
jgi:phosphoglycerate dehydrogenase-like enzyme